MAMTAEGSEQESRDETEPDVNMTPESSTDEGETSPEETPEDAPEDAEPDEEESEDGAMVMVDSIPTVQNPSNWGHPTDEEFAQIIGAIQFLAETQGVDAELEEAFPLLYRG